MVVAVLSVLVDMNVEGEADWPKFLIDSQNRFAMRAVIHLWNNEEHRPHKVLNTTFKLSLSSCSPGPIILTGWLTLLMLAQGWLRGQVTTPSWTE